MSTEPEPPSSTSCSKRHACYSCSRTDAGQIAEADDVASLDDVCARVDDEMSKRVAAYDEDFCDTAIELTRLAPTHFGPP